jgi:hypothetical protein
MKVDGNGRRVCLTPAGMCRVAIYMAENARYCSWSQQDFSWKFVSVRIGILK